MSADPRISLSLYAYHVEDFHGEIREWFNCFLQHPHTRIMDYSNGDLDWSYVKEIEALVRSLAAHDSHDQYEFYCRECGYSTIEKRNRFTVSNIGCPRCHDTMQSLLLDKKTYDSKIKVTFGSGTHLITTPKIMNEGLLIHQIIEPLAKIEQLCHELGVETYFE